MIDGGCWADWVKSWLGLSQERGTSLDSVLHLFHFSKCFTMFFPLFSVSFLTYNLLFSCLIFYDLPILIPPLSSSLHLPLRVMLGLYWGGKVLTPIRMRFSPQLLANSPPSLSHWLCNWSLYHIAYMLQPSFFRHFPHVLCLWFLFLSWSLIFFSVARFYFLLSFLFSSKVKKGPVMKLVILPVFLLHFPL